MKYIRTKDGIYEAIHQNYGREIPVFADNEDGEKYIRGEDVVIEADTIEELCDEFVYTGSKFSPCFRTKGYGNWNGTRIESDKDIHKELQSNGCVFYGAIWTDKGLIYVAKMNDKGELELL